MSDGGFLDIESVSGQAALFAQAREAIDAIGLVAASSPDESVRVWVTVSGSVADIDLDETTYRLDREELVRLITATAQLAAQNAAARAADVLVELEQRQAKLIDQLAEADPEIAAALRANADSTHISMPASADPFDYLPPGETSPNDDW